MIVVVVACALLLSAAAVLVLIRVERGPSMLDRLIALDTLTAVMVASLAVHAAWTGRTDTVPVLVALSLVGFVGSVTVARFAAVEPEGEGRVLSREEVAALEADRFAIDDAELAASDDEHHGGGADGAVGQTDAGPGTPGATGEGPGR